jgi:hypothetical protein
LARDVEALARRKLTAPLRRHREDGGVDALGDLTIAEGRERLARGRHPVDVAAFARPKQRPQEELPRAGDGRLTVVGGPADPEVGEADVDQAAGGHSRPHRGSLRLLPRLLGAAGFASGKQGFGAAQGLAPSGLLCRLQRLRPRRGRAGRQLRDHQASHPKGPNAPPSPSLHVSPPPADFASRRRRKAPIVPKPQTRDLNRLGVGS